jgi:hypothetical protein
MVILFFFYRSFVLNWKGYLVQNKFVLQKVHMRYIWHHLFLSQKIPTFLIDLNYQLIMINPIYIYIYIYIERERERERVIS